MSNFDFSQDILKAKEGKTLNKPFRTPGGPKKFSVYVKNEKGNVVKVNFGDPNMEIKRDDPNRRKNFRARHNCDNPGPKTKARYWSCRQWRGGKKVEASDNGEYEWDGITIFDHNELLTINPSLAYVEEEITEEIEAGCGCDTGCGCGNNENEEEKVCTSESCDDPDCSCHQQQDYASLWENIRKKKERIKSGSGEKMRKKGEKGAPTSEQMEKAKAGHMSELAFDNQSEAMEKAKQMGFDKIHNHKMNGKDVFMPGPSHEALMKKVKETNANEYSDHEVSMAASQMMKIARQSTQLAMMLREMPESDIMAWAQDKISKSEHYVEAVYDYMMYNNSNAALTEKQKKLPPALQKAILKKKGKKPEEKKDDEEKEDKSEAKKIDIEDVKVKPVLMQKRTIAYDMTQEEFDEVMDFEEIVQTKDDLLEAEAAKRPGRKSGAQTPAKPSERKKGSSKNKKGSAGKGGPSITFSAKVTQSLKNKVKEHNAKSKKKVTLSQLKKVYRRGAGAFSTSHRPGQSRGSWAMARVNMFLKMKRGGKVKKSYRDADGDI